MSLELIIAICEVVGAVAVVVSLIYVGYQIRDNTTSQHAMMHQHLSDSQNEANRGISERPEVAELLARANDNLDTLSAADRIRLDFVYFTFFNLWHSAFANYRRGMLEEGIWLQWDHGYEWLFRRPATKEVWNELEKIYEPEFQAHVSEKIKNFNSGSAT